MSLVCPYCQEKFEAKEILFYTDAVQRDFFTLISEARDISATSSAEMYDSFSSSSNVTRSRRRLFEESDEKKETAEKKEDTEQNSAMPLGVSVEDVIAANFLKSYGAGVDFRFQRTATFYGIKEKSEIGPEDKGYGYVIKWEDEDTQTIPSILYVESKDKRLTHRVCPKCHCDLPVDYFSSPAQNRHVAALAGCTSAGKTQFITVALHDLVQQLPNLNLGNAEWTECSSWFHKLYMKKFRDNKRMEGTKTTYKLFPLTLMYSQNGSDDVHFMSFYDCAGEYATNHEFAANQSSFQKADTLLLMVGCDQLFSADVKLSDGELECTLQYQTALAPLRRYDLCPNLQRCIVVLTKCDAIIGKTGFIHGDSHANVNDGMLCYTYDMTPHRNALNMSVIQRIEDELTGMMRLHNEENFKHNITSNLGTDVGLNNVHILAVSTYNWAGDQLVCNPEAEGGRHRVTEPLMLAMAKWNMIPCEHEDYVPEPEPEQRVGFFRRLFGGRN